MAIGYFTQAYGPRIGEAPSIDRFRDSTAPGSSVDLIDATWRDTAHPQPTDEQFEFAVARYGWNGAKATDYDSELIG